MCSGLMAPHSPQRTLSSVFKLVATQIHPHPNLIVTEPKAMWRLDLTQRSGPACRVGLMRHTCSAIGHHYRNMCSPACRLETLPEAHTPYNPSAGGLIRSISISPGTQST